MNTLNIRKLEPNKAPPYDLLYLADPSEEAVSDYLNRGSCYLGIVNNDEIIAVIVLLPTRPFTLELVNLAVTESHQKQGFAKAMIAFAIQQAKTQHYKTLEVGTGNAGIEQMALYQKCGFTIQSVDFDFFRKHYSEPIFENGIECRHMIRMGMDL